MTAMMRSASSSTESNSPRRNSRCSRMEKNSSTWFSQGCRQPGLCNPTPRACRDGLCGSGEHRFMQRDQPGRAVRLAAVDAGAGLGDDLGGALDEHAELVEHATDSAPAGLVL